MGYQTAISAFLHFENFGTLDIFFIFTKKNVIFVLE